MMDALRATWVATRSPWKIALFAALAGHLPGCTEDDGGESATRFTGRDVDASQAGSGGAGPSGSAAPTRPSRDAGSRLDAGRGSAGADGGSGGAASGGSGASPASTVTPSPSTNPNIVPGAWRCTVLAYRDGVCDCGCGADDPDCASTDLDDCERCDATESCATGSCPASIDPEDTTRCLPVPERWTCEDNDYFDDDCDCGCGADDPGCDGAALDDCDTCNAVGACSPLQCPGNIDPDDTTRCVSAPRKWACSDADYFDDDCDCGCGEVDPNCTSAEVASCDTCNAPGSCSAGECPGAIAASDNKSCWVPEGWTCNARAFGDGDCHCGCGALDIDCESASVYVCDNCWSGCSLEVCPGPIDEDDNTICTGPPNSWKCDERFYGDGSLCHCGCGALDPDCETDALASCDRCDFEGSCSSLACPGNIDPDDIARCAPLEVPPEWTCASYAYGNGTCDCGCDVVDIDCDDASLAACESCTGCGSGCPGLVDPEDTTQCIPRPSEWHCDGYMYADGTHCDCGCGAIDPDCETATAESCAYCPYYSGSCSREYCGDIRPEDNAHCLGEAPEEWHCDPRTYSDQACDCGCGAVDRDCASAESDCDLCNAEGSCADGDCDRIDPANNAACLP